MRQFDWLGKARLMSARRALRRCVRIGLASGISHPLAQGARLSDAGRAPVLCLALTSSPNPKRMCDELLKLGACVNQADREGNTPLHLTICNNFYISADLSNPEELAIMLLESGSNPEIKNNQGDTPLTLLGQSPWRETWRIRVCKAMIKAGASFETSGSLSAGAGELIRARLQEALSDSRAGLSPKTSYEFRIFLAQMESWEIGLAAPKPKEAVVQRKTRSP